MQRLAKVAQHSDLHHISAKPCWKVSVKREHCGPALFLFDQVYSRIAGRKRHCSNIIVYLELLIDIAVVDKAGVNMLSSKNVSLVAYLPVIS